METAVYSLLGLTSVTGLGVVLWRAWMLRWGKVTPAKITAALAECRTGDDVENLRDLCGKTPSPLGRLILFAINHLSWPKAENASSLETAARRNGDEQADQGGVQNHADAVRELGGVVEAGFADVIEHGHHADDGADETEQWRDADDDFQHDEAAFEPDDFPPRGGFERTGIFRFRPGEMIDGEEDQAAERRRRFPAQNAAGVSSL